MKSHYEVDPDQSAAAIARAKTELDTAKQARREAEKKAEAALDAESDAAGRVAVAIAKAIQHGADPALVLPFEMLRANRVTRIIASPAELTVKRSGNSLSITGSQFPGWMKITVGELYDYFMPTPLWIAWEEAARSRREKLTA